MHDAVPRGGVDRAQKILESGERRAGSLAPQQNQRVNNNKDLHSNREEGRCGEKREEAGNTPFFAEGGPISTTSRRDLRKKG